jgi:[ribosomal protein S5]-alanine N-acetyltransferase
MYPVEVAGLRLRLREFTDADVDAVYAVYGDAQATRHLSFEPRSREQVAAIVARSVESAAAVPRSEYALAVTRAPGGGSGGEVIGFARLALDPHAQRAATIGFALHPGAWGVGLGTETVHLLCALGFERLDLHRIWAARAPLNTGSARTLRRAGMTEEGRIREHVLVRGAGRDSVTYSILDHEWIAPEGFGRA